MRSHYGQSLVEFWSHVQLLSQKFTQCKDFYWIIFGDFARQPEVSPLLLMKSAARWLHAIGCRSATNRKAES